MKVGDEMGISMELEGLSEAPWDNARELKVIVLPWIAVSLALHCPWKLIFLLCQYYANI